MVFQVIQELKSVSPLITVNTNIECRCWAHRVGGEKVLLLSAAAWGSMTAFTPILAHFCSQPILSMTLSRFLMGLLQGETNSTVTPTSNMHVCLFPVKKLSDESCVAADCSRSTWNVSTFTAYVSCPDFKGFITLLWPVCALKRWWRARGASSWALWLVAPTWGELIKKKLPLIKKSICYIPTNCRCTVLS